MTDYTYIPETEGVPYRLGRSIHHDPRSVAYRVTRTADWPAVRHHLTAPVLDQGELGACTGFAAAACMSFYSDLHDDLPTIWDATGWHTFARTLYSDATRLDPFPGEWPVDDTGSTGLAVAKAAQRGGYLSGYQHILTPSTLAGALHEGPVIVGTYWYESMFDTTHEGLVTVDFNSPRVGGHEYVLDEVTGNGYFGFRNSWGTGYGNGAGRFYMLREDFLRLLREDGDATKLIPVPEPAPVPLPVTPTPSPEPTPEPDADDFWDWLVAFWHRLREWLR